MTAADHLGVLVIGHGTRNLRGLAEFHETTQRFAARSPQVLVEPGFIELAEPSILDGVARLVERGARRIVAVPLLLFAADHARQDIPRLLGEALSPAAHIEILLASVLGCQPQIVELSRLRYRAALAHSPTLTDPPIIDPPTMHVLVGRGSSDISAVTEVRRFAERSHDPAANTQLAVAFVAVARPSLDDTLAEVMAGFATRIVVQPHVLFQGQVLDQIRERVDHCQRATPGKQWFMADHLGPHELVVAALEARVTESLAAGSVKSSTAGRH